MPHNSDNLVFIFIGQLLQLCLIMFNFNVYSDMAVVLIPHTDVNNTISGDENVCKPVFMDLSIAVEEYKGKSTCTVLDNILQPV